MTVRVPNEGDAPIGGKGPRGDMLVRINVATSKVFRRQGSNIHYEARIPMHTALLGGRVRVPTLDGDVDVRVPPGTQPWLWMKMALAQEERQELQAWI